MKSINKKKKKRDPNEKIWGIGFLRRNPSPAPPSLYSSFLPINGPFGS